MTYPEPKDELDRRQEAVVEDSVAEPWRSKSQLHLVLDELPAILWSTDRALHLTSLAGGLVKSLGLDSDAAIGKEMIRSMGVDFAQGYEVGRPRPLEEI